VFARVHIVNVLGVEAIRRSARAGRCSSSWCILPVGYILGWLFQQRGIIASIAGHAAYNAIIVTIAILAQRAVPLSLRSFIGPRAVRQATVERVSLCKDPSYDAGAFGRDGREESAGFVVRTEAS
jgi:hypothetical protein